MEIVIGLFRPESMSNSLHLNILRVSEETLIARVGSKTPSACQAIHFHRVVR